MNITQSATMMLAILLVCSTSKAALVALWRFDGNAFDSSANNNHGTLQNGARFSDDVPDILGGQSLFLDGNSAHVQVPHASSLNITQAMTITVWLKPIMGAGIGAVVLAKNPGDLSAPNQAGNYFLRYKAGENPVSSLHFAYERTGTTNSTNVRFADFSFPLDEWVHLAITAKAGGDLSFWKNGTLLTSIAGIDSFGSPNSSPLYIGAASLADALPSHVSLTGLIDDLHLYNTALDAPQIRAAMLGQIPEPTAVSLIITSAAFFFSRSRSKPTSGSRR